jgi:beta-galactosidase
LLAELCGAEVEDYDSLAPDMSNALEFTLPDLAVLGPLSVSSWCDVLKPNGATVVAHYTRDYYAGKPAITLNEYEQPEGQEPPEDLWRSEGWVVYVGTIGTEHLYRVLADWLLELSGVRPILDAPEGVEVTVRQKEDQRLLFLLNHAENDRDVSLPRPMTDLLSGRSVERMVSLEPNEVMILHDAR